MAQLFGYGSLINTKSRMSTGGSPIAMPVRINGIYRGWNTRVEKMGMMAVGILPREVTTNGVLFPVDDSSLSDLDKREGNNYERREIDLDTIVSLDTKNVPRERTYTYFPKNTTFPNQEHPIVFSYLDVIVTGCLEYGVDFAREFMRTTGDWKHVNNDRTNPLYVRVQEGFDYTAIDKIIYNKR